MSSDTLDSNSIPRFKSIAVFDMETANIPALNYNKVGITEISIYGFATEHIKNSKPNGSVPDLPRVLHKLTMMINPRMYIAPYAEKVTGLDNFMLEYESSFNENAGQTFLNFLNHLQQPVCLVAHNGRNFDFPNIKHVLDKVKLTIPENIYCCDSIRAFHDLDILKEEFEKNNDIESEIDEAISNLITVDKVEDTLDAQTPNGVTNNNEIESEMDEAISNPMTVDKVVETFDAQTTNGVTKNNEIESEMDEEKCNPIIVDQVKEIFNAQARNETTPKRQILSSGAAALKRKRNAEDVDNSDNECEEDKKIKQTSKRSLNFGQSNIQKSTSPRTVSYLLPPGKYWYPPKYLYRLENVYSRIFQKKPKEVHRAESDVLILTQLILHYGKDFIDYAEKHSFQLKSVKPLGFTKI